MKVADVMTRHPVTVGLDASLESVKARFDGSTFHHLLVVDAERVVGVLSDKDLLRALSPNLGTLAESTKDAATLNKRVHQIMTRHPLTLHPEAPVTEAIDLLCTRGISCVPIVDAHQRPLGIVSWRDLLGQMRRMLASEPGK